MLLVDKYACRQGGAPPYVAHQAPPSIDPSGVHLLSTQPLPCLDPAHFGAGEQSKQHRWLLLGALLYTWIRSLSALLRAAISALLREQMPHKVGPNIACYSRCTLHIIVIVSNAAMHRQKELCPSRHCLSNTSRPTYPYHKLRRSWKLLCLFKRGGTVS